MSEVDTLLARIEEYCRTAGVAETTFGRIAVNDGKLLARLRAGGSITTKTLHRVESVLAGPKGQPNATDRTVGSHVQMRRQEVGLSLEDLARELGVRPELMRQYENGTARLGATRLSAAARALDAPIGYFFRETVQSRNSRRG